MGNVLKGFNILDLFLSQTQLRRKDDRSEAEDDEKEGERERDRERERERTRLTTRISLILFPFLALQCSTAYIIFNRSQLIIDV